MRFKPFKVFLYWIIFIALIIANSLFADDQKNENKISEMDQNQNYKIQKLDSLIIVLEEKINKKEKEDALKKLMEEAKALSSQQRKKSSGIGKKFHSGARQQSGLNPNISLGGDFFGAVSSEKNEFINEPSDFNYGTNRFELREVEISLNAPLDPFTRGKTHISFTENSLSVEEAYLQWLNLPLNMNLKMGLFNAEFGLLNRYHDHALPQFDRPRVLVNTFTSGSLGGFGLSGNFLLPRILFSDASNFDASIIRGGNNVSFTSEGDYNLIYTGQLINYYDITEDTYFEWVLGGATGYNDAMEEHRSYLGNLGFVVKWIPIGREKYKTIDWKTEFLVNKRKGPVETVTTRGFYSSLQNKLNAKYWLSARIGYSELPFDKCQNERDYTLCLDYWQSEFVFYRIQYQYLQRNITQYFDYTGDMPDYHTVLFQVCWAMGPHKHEAY